MNHLDYLDFEVEIGQPTGQEYPLTVLRSPAGEARATLVWPFGELALENRLKDLQIALLSSGGVRRTVLTPAEGTVQRFGAELFDLLFTGEVRNRYDVSQERVHNQGKGLRVKLRIQDPRLANLPWEFLYDARRDEYLCLSQQTPLVRYLELPQTIRPLAVRPPLRILGMIAAPADRQALDVAVERQRLERAITPLQAKGLVQLHWLEGATWRDLQRSLRREAWHIFHFVGHGNFDPLRDEGLIAFCNDANRAHLLPAGDLGRLLADQRTLRLAVLNACLGAQGSNLGLFSSTAATLVRRGIPAVVAMQQAITDAAAIEFTQTFYESLADGLPVDAAMSEARKAISFALTNTLEWGTPVLYSRTSDGRLFDVAALASTGSASVERPLAELVEAERGASVHNAELQGVAENLPGKGGGDRQANQPPVAPARKMEDTRYGIATMAAPASRWRQPGLWATLFVIALLVGMVSFRSQLAERFGLAAPGVLPATETAVATTSTPSTVVALVPSATLTPTSTVDSAATAAAVTAEAAATATTIVHQLATNEAVTLTALPTATLTAPPPPTATATATPTNTIDVVATTDAIATVTAEAAAIATTTADQLATTEAATLMALPTATLTLPPLPTATATTTPTPLPTATVTPTPLPVDGDKFTLDAFAMTFVYVSAGSFTMGSPPGEGSDYEHPQHEMPVDAFWIGVTEITNAQYKQFIDAKGYDNKEWWTAAGWQWRTAGSVSAPEYWDDEKWNGANQPVVGVSWYEATAYAAWLAAESGLSIRLPTEAEWEKAARGTDARIYPWGNDWDGKRLNYCDNNCDQSWKDNKVDDGFAYTAPVGNYPDGASPYGALDMAGNVWEWTATEWVANYENYSNVADNEKEGDVTRALRGGSWYYDSDIVRSARRFRYFPYYRNLDFGFRLVVFAPGG